MEEIKQPWERIDAKEETIQKMFSDWGRNCVRRQLLKTAENCYDRSLELKDDDLRVLCYRSQVKRLVGQAEKALEDSRAAAQIGKKNAFADLEVCEGLYQSNDLENYKIELHDSTRKYHGVKVKPFHERIVVVDENFKDSLGESLSPFILENGKHFPAVLELEYQRKYPDKRPLWKQRRDLNKCDVVSINDEEEILLSPLEIARRERAFNVLHQIYFHKSWSDVKFLKKARANSDLLLSQSNWSRPLLTDLTHGGYYAVQKFGKMLQTRSPLYNETARRCSNMKLCDNHREANLYRVQHQTRRNMDSILRTVRELRINGKLEKLSRYVEEVMGDYVVLKTYRVMPWKLEFVVEVYNIVALANIDPYMETVQLTQRKKPKERLLEILRLPKEKPKNPLQFVFGDRSTFQEPDAVDIHFVAYKKFIARLENRRRFSKYDIEKAYLLYEIARSHLKQSRFDECCSTARKAIEAAKNWGSNAWEFLSYLLILKANGIQGKIERFQEVLDNTKDVVKRLKSSELQLFIDQCQSLNENLMSAKKFTQSQSFLPTRGASRGSYTSQLKSNASGETFNLAVSSSRPSITSDKSK